MQRKYIARHNSITSRLFGIFTSDLQRTVLVFVTKYDMSGFGPAMAPELSASLSPHDLVSNPAKKCRDKLIVELPALDAMPRSRLELIAKLARETRSMFYTTATAFDPVEIDGVHFEVYDDLGPPNLMALARHRDQIFAEAKHHYLNGIDGSDAFARWLISGVGQVYSTAQSR